MSKQIIFDLDGTLIDSAPSILASFTRAFSALDITPARPITPDVVGPPLMQTLATLAGQDDSALLKKLADQFKLHYDAEGYQEATVYEGIQTLLETLQQTDATLYIATNKRDLPTRKIMQYLGWDHFFKGVFALDTYNPPLASKPLMVERIMADFSIDAKQAIYIGDRYEDGLAADHNHIAFMMVTWGYADKSSMQLKDHWQQCDAVTALQSYLVDQ